VVGAELGQRCAGGCVWQAQSSAAPARRAAGRKPGTAAHSTHLLFLLLKVVNALSCHSVHSHLCRQGRHHLCQAGGLLGLLLGLWLLLWLGLLMIRLLLGLLLLEGRAAAWHACSQHGAAGAVGRACVGNGGQRFKRVPHQVDSHQADLQEERR
jgi:hypothetical protein